MSYKRKFCLFLLLALSYVYCFFFPKPLFAATVVINEFSTDASPQWVELYNKSTSSVDISGWFIDDEGGTQKYTIPTNTIINSGEFKVFESNIFYLNNSSSDIARLLNGSTVEDSYSYTIGPGTGSTYGRQSDGADTWVTFNTPTKNATNNTATPVPTSTSTPTPSPTPTTIPTPTKTPTPIPTTKPTATSTPKPASTTTPSPTVRVTVTPSPTNTIPPTKTEAKITTVSAVLGEKIEVSPTIAAQENKKAIDASHNLLPQIFMGFGATCLLGCGILVFRAYKKGKIVWHE